MVTMSPKKSKSVQCTEKSVEPGDGPSHPKQASLHTGGLVTTGGADISDMKFNQWDQSLKANKDGQNEKTQQKDKVELDNKLAYDKQDDSEKDKKEVQEKDELQNNNSDDACCDDSKPDHDEVIHWKDEKVVEDEVYQKTEDAGYVAPVSSVLEDSYSIVEWDQKDASTEKDAIISGVHKSRQKTCEPHPKRCRKTRRNKRHATCKGKRGCMKSPSVPGILQATGGSKVKASSSNNCQDTSQKGRCKTVNYPCCGGGGGDGGCGGEPPTPPGNIWKRKPSCDGPVKKKKQQRPNKLVTRQVSHSSLPSPLVSGTPFVSRQSPCFSMPLDGDTHDVAMEGLSRPSFGNPQPGSANQPQGVTTEPVHHPIQRVQSVTGNAGMAMDNMVTGNEASASEALRMTTEGSSPEEMEQMVSTTQNTGPMLEQPPAPRQTTLPRIPVNDNNTGAFIDFLTAKPYDTRSELHDEATQVETRKPAEVESDDMWNQIVDEEELPEPSQRNVSYGENRHMRAYLKVWKRLQRRLADRAVSREQLNADVEEGVIFVQGLHIMDGHYREFEDYYQMEGLLGSGAFGKVYLCKDNKTKFEFVVKKVDLKDFNPNEALIWSELTHPGIVRLLGVVRTGGTICFYSASVAKRTLKSLVSNDRVLSQGDALWYLEQILTS